MSSTSPIQVLRDAAEIAPGALLGGKYRLEGLLAEGGMGNVWLARNELLDLPVALKIVRPDARGKETTARLLMEARVQANLQHPNVARVFDCGETAAGESYLVIELLEGCSLAELLERHGALPPVQVVRLMLPIIDALCAAHRAGVVHRDIKPDNIFLARAGSELCPKLLDFGVAKLSNQFHPRLTGSGGIVGSPAYMAPEQARGADDVDFRADVWAVCVVLYEAVSGKPAFDAENYHALLRRVIESEPAPLVAPEYASLWPIVSEGLRKDRGERTQTMRALGAALARWLLEQGEYDDPTAGPIGRHAELLSRVSETLAASGRRGAHASGPRPKPLPRAEAHTSKRAAPVTLRERGKRREASRKAWRLSLAAACGGGLLVFSIGQIWVSSEEPAHAQAASVVRPAAASFVPLGGEPAPARGSYVAAPAGQPSLETARANLPAAALVRAAPAPTAAGPRAATPDVRAAVPRTSRAREAVRPPASRPPPAPERPAVKPGALAEVLDAPPPAPRRQAAANETDLGLKSPW